MNKIRIRIETPITSKLAFVKIIKNHTGLGLKESKYKADEMFDNQRMNRKAMVDLDFSNRDSIREFQKALKHHDFNCYITGGLDCERNFKMLGLGLGDNEDYSEFLVDYIINSGDNGKNCVNLILDKLSKEDLIEIFGKISKEI